VFPCETFPEIPIGYFPADPAEGFQHYRQFLFPETPVKDNACQLQPTQKFHKIIGNRFKLGNIQGFAINHQRLLHLSDIQSFIVSQDLVDGFLELLGGVEDSTASGWIELDITHGGEKQMNKSRELCQAGGIYRKIPRGDIRQDLSRVVNRLFRIKYFVIVYLLRLLV